MQRPIVAQRRTGSAVVTRSLLSEAAGLQQGTIWELELLPSKRPRTGMTPMTEFCTGDETCNSGYGMFSKPYISNYDSLTTINSLFDFVLSQKSLI